MKIFKPMVGFKFWLSHCSYVIFWQRLIYINFIFIIFSGYIHENLCPRIGKNAASLSFWPLECSERCSGPIAGQFFNLFISKLKLNLSSNLLNKMLKCKIGVDYPRPIVNHSEKAAHNLELIQKMVNFCRFLAD